MYNWERGLINSPVTFKAYLVLLCQICGGESCISAQYIDHFKITDNCLGRGGLDPVRYIISLWLMYPFCFKDWNTEKYWVSACNELSNRWYASKGYCCCPLTLLPISWAVLKIACSGVWCVILMSQFAVIFDEILYLCRIIVELSD